MLDPLFAAAFIAAKGRIRAMEYRYVEEADQNRQALLEIYCAVVLGPRTMTSVPNNRTLKRRASFGSMNWKAPRSN